MIWQLKRIVDARTIALRQKISNLEKTEQALRESEQRVRAVIENQSEFIVRWKADGTRLFVNEAYCRYFQQTYDEIIGTSFFPLVEESYRQMILDKIARLTPDHPEETTVHLALKPDGSTVWQEWAERGIFDANGQLIEIQSVGRDIDARRRAEEAELEQRTFAEALVDTAAALNQALDLDKVLDGVLTNLGRAVKHSSANIMLVTGGTARIVRADHERAPLEYRINDFPLMNALVEHVEPVLVPDTRQHPDWVTTPSTSHIRSLIGVPIARSGKVIGIINVESDTPHFFKEADMRRLQAFADQAALAIHNAQLYEQERRERILSQMFQHIASQHDSDPARTLKPVIESLRELIPQHSAVILLIEHDTLQVVAARGEFGEVPSSYHYTSLPFLAGILSRGEPAFITRQDQHPDWSRLPGIEPNASEVTAWAAVPLTTWDVMTGLLCVTISDPNLGRDQVIEPLLAFTQRAQLAFQNSRLLAELLNSEGDLREAQSHLLRSAELAIAGEIATGVAHQISNPLTSVMAYAYLLIKKTPEGDPLHEYAEAIRDATDRAAKVVQRMLDFARTKELYRQSLDVNESIRSAVALVRPQVEPGIRLLIDLAADLPPVMDSAEHLEDVWINLMINASDALHQHPNAKIEINSAYNPDQHAVVVKVTDNGPGIPNDLQSRIFKSFFTTKEHGVGLGLAICYDTVTEHWGKIHVESSEGNGATFVVTLPANLLKPYSPEG